jgi:hypothetical protein
MLEVYSGNPPPPGAVPIFVWPMDANVPLPIDTFGGNDSIYAELPLELQGPTGGLRFEGGEGADDLHIRSGIVRLGGGASVIASLTIDAGATLDITDNALVVDYAETSPAATVREKIISGRGGAGMGKLWNGTGITSSTAAAVNATAPESRSVGYAENALLALGAYTEFWDESVDNTAVLVAYMQTADANLDGVVNNDDVTVVGANYAPGAAKPAGSAWALGDFDYNGFVDNDDVTLLGVFYQTETQPAGPPENYELPVTNYELAVSASREFTAELDGLSTASSEQPAMAPNARKEGSASPRLEQRGVRLAPQDALSAGPVKLTTSPSRPPSPSRAMPESRGADEALVDLLARAIAAEASEANVQRMYGRRRANYELQITNYE